MTLSPLTAALNREMTSTCFFLAAESRRTGYTSKFHATAFDVFRRLQPVQTAAAPTRLINRTDQII